LLRAAINEGSGCRKTLRSSGGNRRRGRRNTDTRQANQLASCVEFRRIENARSVRAATGKNSSIIEKADSLRHANARQVVERSEDLARRIKDLGAVKRDGDVA
jgi:hypothetical protein